MSDYVLRQYQIDCVDTIKSKLYEKFRGVVYMACGTGKTAIMKHLIEISKSDNIMIIVPQLALTDQIYNVMKDIKKCKVRTVNCEKTEHTLNDEDEIYEFLIQKGKKLLIVTYASMNKIYDIVSDYEFVFGQVFVDEAHHLDTCESINWIMDLENQDNFRCLLFFTATPTEHMHDLPGYEVYDNEAKEETKFINNSRFGEMTYVYPIGKAIDDGYITPYKLVFMAYHTKKYEAGLTKKKMKAIARELEYTLKKLKLKKTITFHRKVEPEAKISGTSSLEFHNILNEISEDEKINYYHVDGSMKMKERKKIMKQFETDKRACLSSCKTMNEGIDIPCIDSILIMDPKFSIIDIIQTIGRPLRKYQGKECAYVIIPIYTNELYFNDITKIDLLKTEFSTITNVCKALREADVNFDAIFQNNKWEEGFDKYFMICDHGKLPDSNIDLTKIKTYVSNKVDMNKYKRHNFEDSLKLIKEFKEKNGRYPSDHSKDPYEGRLGRFITRKKMDKRKNDPNATPAMVEKINNMFPDWQWNQPPQLKNDLEHVKMIKEFVDEHNCMPKRTGGLENERQCASYSVEFRRRYKKDRNRGSDLDQKVIQKLESIPKWSWDESDYNQSLINKIIKMIEYLENIGEIIPFTEEELAKKKSGTKIVKKKVCLASLNGPLKNMINNQMKGKIECGNVFIKSLLMLLPSFERKVYKNPAIYTKENVAIAALMIKERVESAGYHFNYQIPAEFKDVKIPDHLKIENIETLDQNINSVLETKEPVYKFISEKNTETLTKITAVRDYNHKIFKHNTHIRYHNTCIISDINEICILQACHIKPYALFDNKNESYINNGLLMSANYHLLYDNFKFSITPEGKIVYLVTLCDKITADFKVAGTNKILDCNFNEQEKIYLDWHYQKFLTENKNVEKIL